MLRLHAHRLPGTRYQVGGGSCDSIDISNVVGRPRGPSRSASSAIDYSHDTRTHKPGTIFVWRPPTGPRPSTLSVAASNHPQPVGHGNTFRKASGNPAHYMLSRHPFWRPLRTNGTERDRREVQEDPNPNRPSHEIRPCRTFSICCSASGKAHDVNHGLRQLRSRGYQSDLRQQGLDTASSPLPHPATSESHPNPNQPHQEHATTNASGNPALTSPGICPRETLRQPTWTRPIHDSLASSSSASSLLSSATFTSLLLPFDPTSHYEFDGVGMHHHEHGPSTSTNASGNPALISPGICPRETLRQPTWEGPLRDSIASASTPSFLLTSLLIEECTS